MLQNFKIIQIKKNQKKILALINILWHNIVQGWEPYRWSRFG